MNKGDRTLVFVGSLTRETCYFETAEGQGITTLVLNERTGDLVVENLTQGIDNPSYITLDAHRNVLYAVSEVYGWNEGTVSAYTFDRRDGSLGYVNKQPTLGSIAAHCSLDRSGNYLLATNYAHEKWEGFYQVDTPRQAVAVLPLGAQGRLDGAVSSVMHHGSGPVPVRQAQPHPHCAMASPDNRHVLVTDLGVDKVFSYEFEEGKLHLPSDSGTLDMPAGSGPRHLVFSQGGESAYVINELGSTVAHLAYEARSGRLDLLQTISTVPDGFEGENRSADLHLSPDGRFLYGSNRGHDSIVIYRIDPVNGSLNLVGHQLTGGRTPRNFALSPSGRYLLVANQNTHSIVTFKRDADRGTLERVCSVDIGTPMVIKMCAT